MTRIVRRTSKCFDRCQSRTEAECCPHYDGSEVRVENILPWKLAAQRLGQDAFFLVEKCIQGFETKARHSSNVQRAAAYRSKRTSHKSISRHFGDRSTFCWRQLSLRNACESVRDTYVHGTLLLLHISILHVHT